MDDFGDTVCGAVDCWYTPADDSFYTYDWDYGYDDTYYYDDSTYDYNTYDYGYYRRELQDTDGYSQWTDDWDDGTMLLACVEIWDTTGYECAWNVYTDMNECELACTIDPYTFEEDCSNGWDADATIE